MQHEHFPRCAQKKTSQFDEFRPLKTSEAFFFPGVSWLLAMRMLNLIRNFALLRFLLYVWEFGRGRPQISHPNCTRKLDPSSYTGNVHK